MKYGKGIPNVNTLACLGSVINIYEQIFSIGNVTIDSGVIIKI